jgi:hypothetical protein
VDEVAAAGLSAVPREHASKRDEAHAHGDHRHHHRGVRELERKGKRSALRKLRGKVRVTLDLEQTRR